jgi:hypothetical protein
MDVVGSLWPKKIRGETQLLTGLSQEFSGTLERELRHQGMGQPRLTTQLLLAAAPFPEFSEDTRGVCNIN